MRRGNAKGGESAGQTVDERFGAAANRRIAEQTQTMECAEEILQTAAIRVNAFAMISV